MRISEPHKTINVGNEWFVRDIKNKPMMIALSAQDEAAIWRSVECHIWHIRVATTTSATTTKKLSKSETDHKNQRHDPKRQLLLICCSCCCCCCFCWFCCLWLHSKISCDFVCLQHIMSVGGELCKDIETWFRQLCSEHARVGNNKNNNNSSSCCPAPYKIFSMIAKNKTVFMHQTWLIPPLRVPPLGRRQTLKSETINSQKLT